MKLKCDILLSKVCFFKFNLCRYTLVCNFWLVLYTWLQHTDVDVPHFEGDDWNLVKARA